LLIIFWRVARAFGFVRGVKTAALELHGWGGYNALHGPPAIVALKLWFLVDTVADIPNLTTGAFVGIGRH